MRETESREQRAESREKMSRLADEQMSR